MNETTQQITSYLEGKSPGEIQSILKELEFRAKLRKEEKAEQEQARRKELEALSLDELSHKLLTTDPAQNMKHYDELREVHKSKMQQEQQAREQVVRDAIEPKRQELLQEVEAEISRVGAELNYYSKTPSKNWGRVRELGEQHKKLLSYKQELEQ